MKLRDILDNPIFNSLELLDDEAKQAFIKLLGLYGAFRRDNNSEILSLADQQAKLELEFESLSDFNQRVLQKLYQNIRPFRSEGGLVERKDMQNPNLLAENFAAADVIEIVSKIGVLKEKFPPKFGQDANVRIILNGATQFGCQERINYVKECFRLEILDPENTLIDLATGERNLWPDGFDVEDAGLYRPDAILLELLESKTGRDQLELITLISVTRTQIIAELLPHIENPGLADLDAKQKAKLRVETISRLDEQFKQQDENFVWPQESEMFLELSRREFAEFGIGFEKIIVHGGVADQFQGRATGITGLKKVAFDLQREEPASLVVVAGGGHAPRFSSILTEELAALNAAAQFSLYPVGPSFAEKDFSVGNAGSMQNLLNTLEVNLGSINFQVEKSLREEVKISGEVSSSFRQEVTEMEQKASASMPINFR